MFSFFLLFFVKVYSLQTSVELSRARDPIVNHLQYLFVVYELWVLVSDPRHIWNKKTSVQCVTFVIIVSFFFRYFD